MYMGYCVPCTFVIYNGRGAHQWNVQLRTLIGALYVSPSPVAALFRFFFCFLNANSPWKIAVHKHWINNVRNQYYHYKNLDTSSVSESLHARSEDYSYDSWFLYGYRNYYSFLFYHHLF